VVERQVVDEDDDDDDDNDQGGNEEEARRRLVYLMKGGKVKPLDGPGRILKGLWKRECRR
jgi:hypothetical protein